jgi:hypothetical protein
MSASIPAAHLGRIVERFLDGRALPSGVVTQDGRQLPLLDWLETLRFDRSAFSDHLASKLGLMAQPALTCEAALSLRNQLVD